MRAAAWEAPLLSHYDVGVLVDAHEKISHRERAAALVRAHLEDGAPLPANPAPRRQKKRSFYNQARRRRG